MILTPYNFIPLNSHVVIPEWSDDIYHDIPFKDGHSGVIEIEINTKSKLFISRGKKPDRIGEVERFTTDSSGKPIIPGSSIKGMLRSLMEILSFGKIDSDRINTTFSKYVHKPKKTHEFKIGDFIFQYLESEAGAQAKQKNDFRKRDKESIELYEQYLRDKKDFADCIFGSTELKGRVHIEHAEYIGDKGFKDLELGAEHIIMASPHPTYYPNYVKQKIQDTKEGKIQGVYQNWFDLRSNNSRSGNIYISGRKYYPVRPFLRDKLYIPDHYSESPNKLTSTIKPLKRGTTFKSTITYHNLKSVELGALLSAITFHNQEGCYHQLGKGKAFGYGVVNITILKHDRIDNSQIEDEIDFLKVFELYMNSNNIGSRPWASSVQLRELVNLASVHDNADELYDKTLAYYYSESEHAFKLYNRAITVEKLALMPFTQILEAYGLRPKEFQSQL